MGTVFLARDLKYGRQVAVKFLSRRAHATGSVERFNAEIRTAARLNHPNILTLHDSGEADGRLFYVMPYITGASLAERIKRLKRLGVNDALRITRQIAGALAYAHASGIIHRDIKPDNVLLDPDGHVYVADFGLAKALSAARSTRLTGDGHVVGSPLYMSPEQALSDGDLDARSDLYSLGCLLFEMLAGAPPFPGGSAGQLLRRHLNEAPPSLRAIRADMPASLDRIVYCLLEKSPERRYASADALLKDLDVEIARVGRHAPSTGSDRGPWRRRISIGVAGLSVFAIAWALAGDAPRGLLSRIFAPSLDPDLLAVLPLVWDSPVEGGRQDDAMLHAGLTRWSDLRLAPWTGFDDRAGTSGSLSARDALKAARSTGAARYLSGRATSFSDSIQLDLGLYDAAADGALERRVNLRFRRGDQEAVALVVDSLLFGRITWDGEARADIGTYSSAARHAYNAAHAALSAWDLAGADTLFSAAVTFDPAFARAHLWLGQTRLWAGEPPDRWRPQAQRARQNLQDLTARERGLADGLVALGENRFADSCAAFGGLLDRDARDFAALIGRAECLRRDRVVVRDSRSPSGWAYRSSIHASVRTFADAFRALPERYTALRGPAATRLGAVLFTHRNMVWPGRSADGRGFIAFPEWRDDTLAMVPWPEDAEVRLDDAAWDRALAQHRLLYHEIARAWASAFPAEPEALYAMGVGLEMLADRDAQDRINRARAASREPVQALRYGVHEVWLLLKRGLPHDSDDLARARALADSLLVLAATADVDDPRVIRRLKGLALLTGRPGAAARLSRDSRAFRALDVTERASEELLIYAAAGGPAERLDEHERALERSIRMSVGGSDRDGARIAALEQAAFLAYSTHPLAATTSGLSFGSPVARAQAALSAGHPRTALGLLREVHTARQDSHDRVSIDVAYAEAALLVSLGDTANAVAQLNDALRSLPDNQPGTIEDPARAASLVRAMALRAEIAAAAGDLTTAQTWARAVLLLWGHGEPVVQPTLEHMRRIERR